MEHTKQIAKNIKEFYFGGNWTESSLREHLTGVNWEQAVTKVHNFNTIAALVYHINFYVVSTTNVLQGALPGPEDHNNFKHPVIRNEKDWQALVQNSYAEAEKLAALVEKLPDNQLGQTFREEKKGNYYRNLLGLLEHCYYHLGQIVLIKKLVKNKQV